MPYMLSIWDLGGFATRLLRWSCGSLTFPRKKHAGENHRPQRGARKGVRNFVVVTCDIFFSPQLSYVPSRKSRSHISPLKEPAPCEFPWFSGETAPVWVRYICFLVCGRRPWTLLKWNSTCCHCWITVLVVYRNLWGSKSTVKRWVWIFVPSQVGQ